MYMVFLGCFGCSGGGGDAGASADAAVEAAEDAAADSGEVQLEPFYEPVVFAVVSDLHLDGGYYGSIAQNVAGLLADAAGRSPTSELIAVTGDIVDKIDEPAETGEGSIIEAARRLFEESAVPVESVLGNHDYYESGPLYFAPVADTAAREELFQSELGLEPWYYTVHGGARFVYLDSLWGQRSWESMGLNGSLGEDQLAWLEQLLWDGEPAVLFLHHPPSTVLEEGDVTIETLIREYPETVLAVFVGHIHHFARSSIEGVPLLLTEAGYDGTGLHHVRLDPGTGAVEILNEAEIDYGEADEVPCDPERTPGLPDPAALAGATLVLRIPGAEVEPMGLGSYLTALMPELALVLRLGEADAAGQEIPALLASGSFVGDAADGKPPYIAAAGEGACAATALTLDGPCLSTAPLSVVLDLVKTLSIPIPPGWRIRAELTDLTLEGALDPSPAVQQGVFHATVDMGLAVRDVEDIIVLGYCAGTLEGCQPGTTGMPACPEDPGPDFFTQIPPQCDVRIADLGLRIVFSILESVPDHQVKLAGNFETFPACEADTATPGCVAPDLFAPAPDGACPAE